MAWDEEAMLRRFVWGYAHRFAMKRWICGGRVFDPDDRSDYGEVVRAIEFELGQGALDDLDPELVTDAIRTGMVDRVPHW